MKNKLIGLLTLTLMSTVLSGCQSMPTTDPYGLATKSHSAVTLADRANVEWWMPRHEQVLERVGQGNVDLIMVGDSITHGWERTGKDIWDRYYAPRNAVNMGFSGDRTEHVLWRFDHGEISGISPKLAVLMIGTNNSSDDDTAEEIADGIKAICAEIRVKSPKTKILVLNIFPRASGNREQRELIEHGARFNDQWAKNNKASKLAFEIADNKMIYYLDINEAFLDENGVLTREVMPDLLHLSENGYKIWAEAIEPTVRRLMGKN
jgi:beta-glucosidase